MAEEQTERKRNWIKFLFGDNPVDFTIYAIAGLMMALLGLTGLSGGGIAIQPTPESEINLISLAHLPSWLLWATIIVGIDTALTTGRFSKWVVMKVTQALAPIFRTVGEATIGEEKLNSWEQKIKEVREKLNK